ncbi:MAG: peptidase [Cyanobacteria bacterium RYN_339]|nr:peptidase [Cyanobacteria bacterium RYN_339]
MNTARRLTLALLSLATLSACGKTAVPGAALPTLKTSVPSVSVQGVERKLGFDMNRYKTTFSRGAHPTRVPRQGMLPAHVDNRASCAPIYDQGQLGSCTGFAIAKGLREFIQRTGHEAQVPLSAMFLYYEERVLQDTVGEDSGATMTAGLQVLQEKGVAPDSAWPYNIPQFKVKPSQAAYDAAGANKVHSATQVKGLDDVKTVVAKGGAVAIGFQVYQSFMKIGADGVMPMPKPTERVVGGHAVLIVGYDDAKKAVLVRNSWGTKWGQEGYFWMPYAFVADENNADDFWTAD